MDTNKIIQDLTKLDKQIEDAKKSVAQLEGASQQILETLKKDFGIKSLAEAEDLLSKKQKELDSLEKNIQTDYSKLKESFEW